MLLKQDDPSGQCLPRFGLWCGSSICHDPSANMSVSSVPCWLIPFLQMNLLLWGRLERLFLLVDTRACPPGGMSSESGPMIRVSKIGNDDGGEPPVCPYKKTSRPDWYGCLP